jgi:tetratricopeptide (TPR) repeat protein
MVRRGDAAIGAYLGGAVLLVFISSARINKTCEWRYPPVNSLVVSENYAGDLGPILLGSHRLAGDIAYIQFLQYYGEEGNSAGEGLNFGKGRYPRTYELGTRIMRLDPFFNSSILEVAGSLAFNLNEATQGLELLGEAVKLDPAFYRYRLYMAAILYKNVKKDDRLIGTLEEAIKYPDCPVLLQHVLGNLLKKSGDYMRAGYVYRHILETSKRDADKETAATSLKRLIAEHPEARKVLDGPGRY